MRLRGDIGRIETALLRGPAVALVTIQLDLLLALTVLRVGNRIVAIALLLCRGLINRLVLRRVDHHIILTVGLIRIVSARRQKQQAAADPHFLRIRRQPAHPNAIRRGYHDIAWALRAIPVASGIKIILPAIRDARVTARHSVYRVARSILRAGTPAVAVSIRATFPSIIGAAIAGLPIAVVTARNVLIVALTRLLGLPRLSGATLDRQVVLALAQLLTLLVLLLLNLPLLVTLLLIDLLLLLTLHIALLQLLLLDLLLLLALDLTLLILLLLNLTLLVVLLLIDLLLLLALDITQLVLLLLYLTLLIILLLKALLLLLTLHIALLILLLLTLLPIVIGAAVKLVLPRFIAFISQRLSTDAQTQQTYTRELPDARFHAFLTRARVDVVKTA